MKTRYGFDYSVSELRESIRAELSRRRRGDPTRTDLSEQALAQFLQADTYGSRDKLIAAGLGPLMADGNLPIVRPKKPRIIVPGDK
jgi:hypothetical protein